MIHKEVNTFIQMLNNNSYTKKRNRYTIEILNLKVIYKNGKIKSTIPKPLDSQFFNSYNLNNNVKFKQLKSIC